MQGIIAFILIFFVVVTIHEFGHFIAAKRAGILCQEFAIGMGSKIFHKIIGETNFTIRPLPVGGYVKMPDNVFDFNNDMSAYDLKKGMKVSLKLDENDKVEKNFFLGQINFVLNEEIAAHKNLADYVGEDYHEIIKGGEWYPSADHYIKHMYYNAFAFGMAEAG